MEKVPAWAESQPGVKISASLAETGMELWARSNGLEKLVECNQISARVKFVKLGMRNQCDFNENALSYYISTPNRAKISARAEYRNSQNNVAQFWKINDLSLYTYYDKLG